MIQNVEKFNSISVDYSTEYKVGFIANDIILCILCVASTVNEILNVAKAMVGAACIADDVPSIFRAIS